MGQTFIPKPTVIRGPLDEQGSLLNLDRISGENLVDYSKRLRDTFTNRASSTYEGLVNGINRELGLDLKDLIKIDLKHLGEGDTSVPGIIVDPTKITVNINYSNLIDGVDVIAIGTKLTDNTQDWTPEYLRGYNLNVAGESYRILDNTATEVTIEGDLSGLVGETYVIEPDWEENVFSGLGLRIGDRKYKILENTSNIISISFGNMTEVEGEIYQIVAYNPKVEATASVLKLYKDFSSNESFQLERSINLREDVIYHREIVDIINGLTFFKAIDLIDSRENILASILKKQTSERTVLNELVPSARFFKLENHNIKDGSIRFSEYNIFLREVEQEQVSQARGNYHVDYNLGIIRVNGLPSGNKTAYYKWNEFPFTLLGSPAIINAFDEEDIQQFLFYQREMTKYNSLQDRFISSRPKADMIEHVSELINVRPLSWGK